MYDAAELYDDLVAIRHAQSALPETASRETRTDLKVVIKRVEGKLTLALSFLPEDEREQTIESLTRRYGGEARRDLEQYCPPKWPCAPKEKSF